MQIFANPIPNWRNMNRNAVFDLLKMFAMLSVVLDHCLQRWIGPSVQTSQLYNFIFLFQMPTFMFVAGFFSWQGQAKICESKNSFFSLLIKKTIGLLVPFFTFSLISAFVDWDCFGQTFFDAFLYPQTSLWFLWALFFLELFILLGQLAASFLRLDKHLSFWRVFCSLVIFVSAVITVFILHKRFPDLFATKLISYYSIFFISGYVISALSGETKMVFSLRGSIFGLFTSLIVLVAVMLLRPMMIFDEENFPNLFLRIIGSYAVICLVLSFCKLLSQIKNAKFFAVFGRYSMEMYVTHLLLFKIPVFNNGMEIVNPFLLGMAFFGRYAAFLILTFATIMVLKSNAITDFVFYGKPWWVRTNNQTISKKVSG